MPAAPNLTWPPAVLRFVASLLVLLGLAAGASAQTAGAPADWPARAGRLAEVQGSVWWYDAERADWLQAERNRVLTEGDRVATETDGRAELRIGSTVLRLGGGAELEVLRLDDGHMHFGLAHGSLALRVTSGELARQLQLETPDGRFVPRRAGHYRVDQLDASAVATVWEGEMLFEGRGRGMPVVRGERLAVRDGGARWERSVSSGWRDDAFAAWVLDADRREPPAVAFGPLSPELTGAEALARHGQWDLDPRYGAVWVPAALPTGWSPFSDGRWVWLRPWGWTWIDAEPWGFATSHYGRWVGWRGGWAWWPGVHAVRPVFAPALVVWSGPPSLGFSLSSGGPGVGWVPLPPRSAPVRRVIPWPPPYPVEPRFAPHPRHGWRDGPERRDDREPGRDRPPPIGAELPPGTKGPQRPRGEVEDRRRRLPPPALPMPAVFPPPSLGPRPATRPGAQPAPGESDGRRRPPGTEPSSRGREALR